MRTLLTVAFIVMSTPVLACNFDEECGFAEKCIKLSGHQKSYCSNYESGLRDPLDLTAPERRLCSSDIDCGLGGTCLAVGSLYGTCAGM